MGENRFKTEVREYMLWRGGVIPSDIDNVDKAAVEARLEVLYREKEIFGNNLRTAKESITRTQGESLLKLKEKLEKSVADTESQINSYKSEISLGKGITRMGYDSDLETGKPVTLIGEDGKPFQTTPVKYIGLDKEFVKFYTKEA